MANYIEEWLQEMMKLFKKREQNIKELKEAKYLDDQRLRSMDSTLKKVTAFTKKLKNIGTISASQFLLDLERYNLSKYLDEIAVNICEAKIKTTDLESLLEFCVKMASLYKDFPAHLIQAFRKQMPTKKGDKIENLSKLRVDLKFYSELLLNGVFISLETNEGMKLLGSVLVYLIQTDKNEHLNVSILMPFCRNSLFTLTGILPLSIINSTSEKEIPKQKLISKIIAEEKSILIAKLFNDYWDSLVEHANKVRQKMNKLQKSIKRQERTRGDASTEDRQNFEQSKQTFDRLHQSAIDLGECLGKIVPEMAEEPSDDEKEGEEARRLDNELSQGRILLWPDRDTELFYESLLDITAYTPTLAAQAIDLSATEQEQQNEQIVNESIENVDLSCLEEQQNLMQAEMLESGNEVEEEIETFDAEEHFNNAQQQNDEQPEDEALVKQQRQNSPSNNILPGGPIQQSSNFHELLERMPICINKDLVDAAAVDFLKNYSRNKAYRKKLIQHFLQCPVDRLDLLPFYARFMATVKPAYPEIPKQVMNELLTRFRTIVQQKNTEMEKKSAEIQQKIRIDSRLHICSYLSELCKFGILPKAEALTCLRSLLVQMRSFKLDMLCVMIEQMGPFLHRSPDAHSKMSVIMQVLKEKSQNVKDPRQKILLENAYFAVIPPDDQQELGKPTITHQQPPMQEFIQYKLATEIRVSIFRRINWDDEEIREFTLKLLSSSWRIHFGQLACLASLVSALGDHHDWIAVRVLDDVLEFIRLSLELNFPRLQQITLSSVAYLGQLFNYNVCNTATLFKIFYQFISLGIDPPFLTTDPSSSIPMDQFFVRLQRIRLVCQLIDVVCEFFCTGKSKKRMDHFLCFFLRFYYETRDGWSQFVEELDEFPDDVCQGVADLMQTWRKGEQFPTALAEARQKIEQIEQIYKTKVEEVLAGIRSAMESREGDGDEGGETIRLKRIMEEDEEGQEEENSTIDEEEAEDGDEWGDEEEEGEGDEEDGRIRGRQRHKQKRNSNEEEEMEMHEFGDEEEQIRVRTHKPEKMLPEDEDFMRDFDRMMAESLQSAPITLQGPMSDLVVPPQAKQKFERKLTFVNETPKATSGYDIFPSASVNERTNSTQQPSSRMALMLRGGGKGGGGGMAGKNQILLKQVQIAESENLAEKWRQAKEEQERDRREMKKVTLALNERMAQEADEMHRQQQIADLERKMMISKSAEKDEPTGNDT